MSDYTNIKECKVKIKADVVIKGLYSEEEILDLSILESIYEVRKLKAVIECMQKGYIVARYPINRFNQCFSEEFDICFLKEEFIVC